MSSYAKDKARKDAEEELRGLIKSVPRDLWSGIDMVLAWAAKWEYLVGAKGIGKVVLNVRKNK